MNSVIQSRQLADISDLAANYSDRQGLRIVPMAMVVMAQANPTIRLARIGGIEWTVILLAAGIAAYFVIGRLYEKRFGRVEEIPAGGMSFIIQLPLFAIALGAGLTIDLTGHRPLFASGLVIAAWILLNAWPARTVRTQYVVIALLLAAICLLPAVGIPTARVAETYGNFFGALFLGAGLAEHFRLVRLMGAAGVSDAETAI